MPLSYYSRIKAITVQSRENSNALFYYLLICNFCKALELQSDFWLVDNSGPKEKK